jgi:hypothetical protein
LIYHEWLAGALSNDRARACEGCQRDWRRGLDALASSARNRTAFDPSGRVIAWHVLCSSQRSPMRGRWRLWMTGPILAACSLVADGCLIRTYPIPPPTAERTSAITCAPPLCPDGGVTYVIEGNGSPGALVIAENVSRAHLDGHRYVASAWAQVAAVSDGGTSDAGGDGGVPAAGHFTIVFSPEPEPDGSVTVCRPGDAVVVTQFVRNENGLYQQSSMLMLNVPSP